MRSGAETALTAKRAASVYNKWGKGIHPASLNFGEYFAYDLASENECLLLFVGDDFFRQTLRNIDRQHM